jgi:uncharacterized protein (DUF885 family)
MVLGLGVGRGQDAASHSPLGSLVKEMWEDHLQREPEVASTLGDRRYNDQVKDLSAKAWNEELARDRQYLVRLTMTDTSGASRQDQQLAAAWQEELFEAEDGAQFKEWELPVSRFDAVQVDMAANVAKYPFATVKDYDDYIARLKKYPDELRLASSNMLVGVDDSRVQPAFVLEKSLKQTEEIADTKPEASVFAAPLKKFPPAVTAAERKRISEAMLEAIQDEVLPAYARFATFLKTVQIPAAEKDGGVWVMKDADAYYDFCVKRAATWQKITQLQGK